jgi:gas vesicle protein
MNTNGKIIAGFLMGTLIGAITGLLMAPATGNRTRKNISKKSKKLMKQLASIVKKEKPRTTGQHKNGRASVASRQQ